MGHWALGMGQERGFKGKRHRAQGKGERHGNKELFRHVAFFFPFPPFPIIGRCSRVGPTPRPFGFGSPPSTGSGATAVDGSPGIKQVASKTGAASPHSRTFPPLQLPKSKLVFRGAYTVISWFSTSSSYFFCF